MALKSRTQWKEELIKQEGHLVEDWPYPEVR
jgi:hypothetical protein